MRPDRADGEKPAITRCFRSPRRGGRGSSFLVMRLVLLHALPLDGTMWVNEMRPRLYPAIAPALYNLGESLEDWAVGVLDIAGDGPLVLVGSSVGGSCALEVARLAPHRVAAVVLIGAKTAHHPEPSFRDEAIRLLADGGMAEAWPRYWAPLFGARTAPAVVETARRVAFQQDISDVIRGVRAFHGRPDRAGFAQSWHKPLIVISGDQDRTPPPATAATVASSAPRGEFHLVKDAGHYVSLEQPSAIGGILRLVLHDLTDRP